MMSLVGALNLQRYAPRFYIAAATDNMSLAKAQRAEAQIIQESPASEMVHTEPQINDHSKLNQ